VGVHLFVDEQALGEPTADIVRTHFLEVVVASRFSRPRRCPTNHSTDAGLGQIDKGVLGCDVGLVLEALEITLDVGGEEGIARLPAVAAGVFPSLDPKPVLTALSLLNKSLHTDSPSTRINPRQRQR